MANIANISISGCVTSHFGCVFSEKRLRRDKERCDGKIKSSGTIVFFFGLGQSGFLLVGFFLNKAGTVGFFGQ